MTLAWRRLVGIACVWAVSACGATHGLNGVDAGSTSDTRAIAAQDGARDATVLLDRFAPVDGARTSDGRVQPGNCAADNATINACSNAAGDRLVVIGAFFDGRECVLVDGPCAGPDCYKYTGWPAERAIEACETANAECDAIKCSRSGGLVRDGCATRCGVDQGFCLQAVCDCGPGKTFISGRCTVDPSCTANDLCRATGGTTRPDRAPPPPPRDAGMMTEPVNPGTCECPNEKRFIEGRGCIAMRPSDACVEEACLCGNTGGAWLTDTCAEVRCGVGGRRGCEAVGCACPPERIWDPTLGCIDSFECKLLERLEGAECNTDGDCEDSLACCSSCGARLCARTCRRRVCQSGATMAMCPPPPP